MNLYFPNTMARFFPNPAHRITGPIALALGVLVLGSGCSFYNVTTQASVTSAPGIDSVEISLERRLFDESESFEYLGVDVADVALDNYVEGHVIRAERPGYFPENLPVFRERLNRWKGIDLLFAVGLNQALVHNDVKPWEAKQWAQGISLLYNVLGLAASPWRVYLDSYEIPRLEPMPRAPKDAPPVWIEGVHFAIGEGDHRTEHFRTREAYYRNRSAFEYSNTSPLDVEYTNLDEDAMYHLWEQGYQGPNGYGLFTIEDEVALEAAIVSVFEKQIGNLAQYTLETKWWVHNPYGLPTDTVTYFKRSSWGFASGTDSPFDRQALSDVIVETAFEAAGNPLLRQEAARKDSLEALWKSGWTPIMLEEVAEPAGKLSRALSSIVTIEDPFGHGSGCILTDDGFVLTNHHVVLDSTVEHTVHFQDGSSLKAKVVRYHPLYDLALLKVDTFGLQPFKPDCGKEILEVGDEVYAVGTPYDIALGASVTRGIVSAVRKDGKRTLIQTDVSISPGNSGGALVRADGTLVGIVNEKIMELGVEGLGFAIPFHYVEEALLLRYRNGD